MTPMEILENSGRLSSLKILQARYSPVQFEILVEASQTGTGFLPLGVGLNYEVDGEPVTTYLNRANTRSLRKKYMVEETFYMNGLRKEITGIKLTKYGQSVAAEIQEALKGIPFSQVR